MFQSFDVKSSPETAAPRIKALRMEMAKAGVDAYLVPHADEHQSEYLPASAERLAWLTGFTGSAGFQNRSWFLPMDEITTVDGKRLPRFSTRYLESAPSPFSVDLRYREIHEGGLAATPTSSESILRVVYESRQGLHLLGKQHFALLDNA